MNTHTLKVGDILFTTFEKVDFYEVTKVKTTFVIVKQIISERTTRGYIAIPGKYIGHAMRRYVRDHNYITVDYLYTAKPWLGDPKYPVINKR